MHPHPRAPTRRVVLTTTITSYYYTAPHNMYRCAMQYHLKHIYSVDCGQSEAAKAVRQKERDETHVRMRKKLQGDDVLAMFGCIVDIIVSLFPLPPFIPIDRVSAGDNIPGYVRSSQR